MTRHVALGTLMAAALVSAPAMTAVVEGQGAGQPTVVTMTAGEEKEICSGVKATVTPSPAKSGDLRTEGDPKGDAPVRLLYKAKDTTAAVSESVTCTVGDKKTPVTINITPKPSAPAQTPNKDANDPRNSTTNFSEAAYPEAFKALFLLFVLAALLESALAILFNWRPFVETFNARAVRPLVSLVFALVFVYMFRLDIVTGLAKLISPAVPELDDTGKILTAMVIAGGSAAVNNLMVGLGFRQVRTPETVVAKPPADKGWISVSIVRTPSITGPVTVAIGVAAGAQVPVVASLVRSTRPGYRYFFRDPGRFPGSGGYPVKKGDSVTVQVSALKSDGAGTTLQKTWGPNLIADAAIIDLTFTMAD
jgi:hypothetical protein